MAAVPGMKKAIGKSEGEWSKTGTCLSRPDDGWIHSPDQLEAQTGVCYGVRYIGNMAVTVSMKTLNFELRTAVARESICRVVEAAGLKNANLKKKRDKKILKYMGESPNLQYAGTDVTLNITTDHVSMISMETEQIVMEHNMEEISFASGGDSETADFVAYVAKNSANNRACHVLECGGGIASEVIITIAQAFELRYKEMLKKKKQPVVVPDREVHVDDVSAWGDEEPMYYNESAQVEELRKARLHGELPPPIPPLPDHYSSRPSNLPVPDQFSTPHQFAEHNHNSPQYENTSGTDALGAPPGFDTAVDSPRNEPWFHGKLKRNDAERKLASDGDFLVRESSNKSGQFVLSGMKNGIIVHLLLVDPEGVVRTKDRQFDNVSHLISYHKDNIVPILSQDIELYLSHAILK